MTRTYDWRGAVGDIWAAEWRRTDRSFTQLSPRLDAAILAAAPPGPFRALDIGCGAGGTTLALAAARPDAAILGVDLSPGLVDMARARAEAEFKGAARSEPVSSGTDSEMSGTPGGLAAVDAAMRASADLTFVVGDAVAVARQHAPFDLFYSRHGVMFFDDPVAAFAGLHAAAAAGAALVFSCFADWADNAFASTLAEAVGATLPMPRAAGPFAFADPDHVAAILDAAGWRDALPVRVPFTYRAGAGEDPVADALSFFQHIGPAAPILRAAAPDARTAMLARMTAVLAAHRSGDAIDFPASAWIWSARA